jgi:hypothetical protein
MGKQAFPSLTSIAIRNSPRLVPSSYGWIAPNLQHFTILCSATSGTQSPLSWLQQKPPVHTQLLKDHPNLIDFTFSLANWNDFFFCRKLESENWHDFANPIPWLRLRPPSPLPWKIKRVLLLAVLKPNQANAATRRTRWIWEKPNLACPMSTLSPDLMSVVLEYVGQQGWTVECCLREGPKTDTALENMFNGMHKITAALDQGRLESEAIQNWLNAVPSR